MSKKNEQSHLIELISLALLLISAIMISYYFITERINKCTSDPLKFAVEKIIKENPSCIHCSNYSFIVLEIYLNESDFIPIKTYSLNLKK